MLQTLKKHPVFSKHVVQSFCRVNYSKKVCKNFREEEGLSNVVCMYVYVYMHSHTPHLFTSAIPAIPVNSSQDSKLCLATL